MRLSEYVESRGGVGGGEAWVGQGRGRGAGQLQCCATCQQLPAAGTRHKAAQLALVTLCRHIDGAAHSQRKRQRDRRDQKPETKSAWAVGEKGRGGEWQPERAY